MSTLKKSTTYAVLRAGVFCCLAVFILCTAGAGILQGTFISSGVSDNKAKNGTANLPGSGDKNSTLCYLNGEWEYYPGIFHIDTSFDRRLLYGVRPQPVRFPIDSVKQSTGQATYRLVLNTNHSLADYVFYLQNYNEDFAVYVNGKRVMPIWGGPQEKLLYTLSDYLFRIDFPTSPGETEIIISANSSANQSLLYQNPIIFGPADKINDYVIRIWRDDTFLIGLVLVLVIVGLVFMLMRTKLDMLSSITLFDTFLAIRILLGFNIATYFIHQIAAPFFEISRVDFVAFQYVAFFITGTFGCLLSQSIFDPKRKLPDWPIRFQVIVCIIGSIFTLLFYRHASMICIGILFLLFFGSFLIVTWHVYHMLASGELNSYHSFQIVKTYYIGGVMAIDILYLRGEAYNAMVYAYVLFLFAHLLARLMDNNARYEQAERLNHNLEQMITDRTRELTAANRRLSELSIRDPLTQAHNRLYFEKTIEKILGEAKTDLLYLCIFDLDFFKKINDEFGHGAGDEQLKYVVAVVHEHLKDQGKLYRIGGEEFVILFTEMTKDTILDLLESIRLHLEKDAMDSKKHTTASFGLAAYRPGFTPKDLMRLADQCLYSAKKLGRNCIITR